MGRLGKSTFKLKIRSRTFMFLTRAFSQNAAGYNRREKRREEGTDTRFRDVALKFSQEKQLFLITPALKAHPASNVIDFRSRAGHKYRGEPHAPVFPHGTANENLGINTDITSEGVSRGVENNNEKKKRKKLSRVNCKLNLARKTIYFGRMRDAISPETKARKDDERRSLPSEFVAPGNLTRARRVTSPERENEDESKVVYLNARANCNVRAQRKRPFTKGLRARLATLRALIMQHLFRDFALIRCFATSEHRLAKRERISSRDEDLSRARARDVLFFLTLLYKIHFTLQISLQTISRAITSHARVTCTLTCHYSLFPSFSSLFSLNAFFYHSARKMTRDYHARERRNVNKFPAPYRVLNGRDS